uniref:40S ribosomal protein S15a-1-like n=1 Tax=Tanacetum cinerariifolium TaxID=118510 RepID=A0A6L2LSY7_TANCI|nr:40S ribosomal protein S15a-1-like [Tanacetum cinerariifolium]
MGLGEHKRGNGLLMQFAKVNQFAKPELATGGVGFSQIRPTWTRLRVSARNGYIDRFSRIHDEDLKETVTLKTDWLDNQDATIRDDWNKSFGNNNRRDSNLKIFIPSVCQIPLCKTKRGGLKDTYPDDILAHVLKRKNTNPSTEVKDIVVGSAFRSGSQREIECELAALYVGFLAFYFVRMVTVSILNDALKSMYNAEKRGKRQVMTMPSSKVIIKFLIVMQKHAVGPCNGKKLIKTPVDSSQGTGKWFGHGAPDVMDWIGFGLGPRECSSHVELMAKCENRSPQQTSNIPATTSINLSQFYHVFVEQGTPNFMGLENQDAAIRDDSNKSYGNNNRRDSNLKIFIPSVCQISLFKTKRDGLKDTYPDDILAPVLKHAQPGDTNELFQKLLEDLQIIREELSEYINSLSWNYPIFFNDNEDHSVQYKEYLENSSNEIAASNSNQEKEKPPQDFDIHQLVREECCIEVCKKQKQNMENTMLELVEVYRQKEFYCMHDNVDDLIESALNSKLLSINLNSQRLDKKKQEVKNIVEQPTKRETRIEKSLQNFRVVHKKSSISLKNTSQISLIHAIAPILPNKEPEYSLNMGYEHLSTTPETESDEVTESSVKNLVLIPSEYEVTSDDESEYDVPIKDDSSPALTTFSNPLFDYNDDFTSNDDESLPDEDVPIENFNEFSSELAHINPILPEIKEADFDLEEEILKDSDSFMDEIDLFLATDELLPPNIESDGYDSEGDIHFLEELLVDDSIPIPENDSSSFDHQNDLLFPRPLPKPPDVESFFDLEPELISAVMNVINELNEDECFDPGGDIDIFAVVEDDDYFPFKFVIRIFLPYLIYLEVSPLLLSAGSEDTIFDPGISV